MNKDNDLGKIVSFLKEAEKLKLVERIPYLSDTKRRENDAEHSWYLCLMLLALDDRLNIKFDVLRTHKMIIVHDLVEIYTGDDWVTDEKEKKSKKLKELNAAKTIFNILPVDLSKKMLDLWKEYDSGLSIEAKIAKGLDKISYTLQYSISKKIEWNKKYATKKESRDYALPHISHNEVLTELFDCLLDELEDMIEQNVEKNSY